MIRASVLLLAAVLTVPAFYRAFVTGELDVTEALVRYLIAVAISAVMLAALRMVTAGYGQQRPNRLAFLTSKPVIPDPVEPTEIDGPARHDS